MDVVCRLKRESRWRKAIVSQSMPSPMENPQEGSSQQDKGIMPESVEDIMEPEEPLQFMEEMWTPQVLKEPESVEEIAEPEELLQSREET